MAGTITYGGNYREGANEKLIDIITRAAAASNYRVRFRSGYRPGDSRQHGKRNAIDITLIDPQTGQAIPDYQNAESFRAYEQFAQAARGIQRSLYPELDKKFRWGGYFSSSKGLRGYGAVDLMHFDLAGDRYGMRAGSWKNGLTNEARREYPGAVSVGFNDHPIPPGAIPDVASATDTILPIPETMSDAIAMARRGADDIGEGTAANMLERMFGIQPNPVDMSSALAYDTRRSVPLPRQRPAFPSAPVPTQEQIQAMREVPGNPGGVMSMPHAPRNEIERALADLTRDLERQQGGTLLDRLTAPEPITSDGSLVGMLGSGASAEGGFAIPPVPGVAAMGAPGASGIGSGSFAFPQQAPIPAAASRRPLPPPPTISPASTAPTAPSAPRQMARLPSGNMAEVGSIMPARNGEKYRVGIDANGDAVLTKFDGGILDEVGSGSVLDAIVQEELRKQTGEAYQNARPEIRATLSGLGDMASSVAGKAGDIFGGVFGGWGGGASAQEPSRGGENFDPVEYGPGWFGNLQTFASGGADAGARFDPVDTGPGDFNSLLDMMVAETVNPFAPPTPAPRISRPGEIPPPRPRPGDAPGPKAPEPMPRSARPGPVAPIPATMSAGLRDPIAPIPAVMSPGLRAPIAPIPAPPRSTAVASQLSVAPVPAPRSDMVIARNGYIYAPTSGGGATKVGSVGDLLGLTPSQQYDMAASSARQSSGVGKGGNPSWWAS